MEEEGRTTSANRSERTVVNDPERTAVVPRFDEKSVRRARPAVPLGRARAAVARRTNPLVVLVLLVGLLGVAAGAVGTYFYQKRRPEPRAAATPEDASRAATTAPASTADGEELFKPTAEDLPDVSPPDPQEAPRGEQASAEGPAAGARPAGGEEEALHAALGSWIDATNARDIGRQMEFYDARLDAYYLSRGTPAAAVRAEKVRVFNRARSVEVRAGAPAVRFSPDGRTATMRFRKSYQIDGARGEVVQELRWRRAPDGWKIVSERDVRVIK